MAVVPDGAAASGVHVWARAAGRLMIRVATSTERASNMLQLSLFQRLAK